MNLKKKKKTQYHEIIIKHVLKYANSFIEWDRKRKGERKKKNHNISRTWYPQVHFFFLASFNYLWMWILHISKEVIEESRDKTVGKNIQKISDLRKNDKIINKKKIKKRDKIWKIRKWRQCWEDGVHWPLENKICVSWEVRDMKGREGRDWFRRERK